MRLPLLIRRECKRHATGEQADAGQQQHRRAIFPSLLLHVSQLAISGLWPLFSEQGLKETLALVLCSASTIAPASAANTEAEKHFSPWQI